MQENIFFIKNSIYTATHKYLSTFYVLPFFQKTNFYHSYSLGRVAAVYNSLYKVMGLL